MAAVLAGWVGAAALLAEDAKLTQHECAPYTRVLLSYDVHSTNIIVRLLYFSSGTRSQNEAFVPGPHGMLPLEICCGTQLRRPKPVHHRVLTMTSSGSSFCMAVADAGAESRGTPC